MTTVVLFGVLLVVIALVVLMGLALCRAAGLASRGEDLTSGDYYDIDAARANPVLLPPDDDLMAVADAAPPHAEDFELWEEQCYSLTPLAERVVRIREKHR